MLIWRTRRRLQSGVLGHSWVIPGGRTVAVALPMSRHVQRYALATKEFATAASPAIPSDVAAESGLRPHRSPSELAPTPTISSSPRPKLLTPRAAPRKRSSPLTFIERLRAAPTRPHPSRTSVLVRPAETLPHQRETRYSWGKHVDSLARQLRLQNIRQSLGLPVPDWRATLMLLDRSTPAPSGWQTLVLNVDPSTFNVESLLRGQETGLRSINIRTGCILQYLWVQEDKAMQPGEMLKIVVYGPPGAVDRAVDLVLEVTKTAKVTRPLASVGLAAEEKPNSPSSLLSSDDDDEAGMNDEPPDGVVPLAQLDVEKFEGYYGPWNRREFLEIYGTYKPLDQISSPSRPTKYTFEAYIAALTNSRTPTRRYKALHGGLHDGGEETNNVPSHQKLVATRLHQAFAEQGARDVTVIRRSAFQRALEYLCRRDPALRKEAKEFLELAKSLAFPIGRETFNTMLAGFSRAQDLGEFHAGLVGMLRAGHVPNMRTWRLFLDMIESGDVRRHVLEGMHSKGLLDSPTSVNKVAVAMMEQDATVAMAAGKTLEEFIASQDKLYGNRRNWLTLRSGNMAMEVLGRYGRFKECLDLMTVMRSPDRSIPSLPDVVTFNTILTHALVQRRIEVAVHVMLAALSAMDEQASLSTWPKESRIRPRPTATPDEVTFNLLFQLAWRFRFPLAVGVVWHYAALAGKTTRQMRKHVSGVLRALEYRGQNSDGAGAGDAADPAGAASPPGWVSHHRSLAALATTIVTVSVGDGAEVEPGVKEQPEVAEVAEVAEAAEVARPRGKIRRHVRLDEQLMRSHRDMVPALPLAILFERAVKMDRAWYNSHMQSEATSEEDPAAAAVALDPVRAPAERAQMFIPLEPRKGAPSSVVGKSKIWLTADYPSLPYRPLGSGG